MGSVIIKGLLCLKISPEKIAFSGIDKRRINEVRKELKVVPLLSERLVNECETIFVCVKPAEFRRFEPFLIKRASSKLVISIMAGVPIFKLQKVFVGCKIIRAMPNLGGQVGQSMTGWFAKKVSQKEILLAKKYLSSFGKAVMLKSEGDIDKFTALIGSGPAYLYFLMEILEEKAIEFGFSRAIGVEIVTQMIRGAFEFLHESKKSPEELIKFVASKGGTTEKALSYFEDKQIKKSIKEGIEKAYDRAREMARLD